MSKDKQEIIEKLSRDCHELNLDIFKFMFETFKYGDDILDVDLILILYDKLNDDLEIIAYSQKEVKNINLEIKDKIKKIHSINENGSVYTDAEKYIYSKIYNYDNYEVSYILDFYNILFLLGKNEASNRKVIFEHFEKYEILNDVIASISLLIEKCIENDTINKMYNVLGASNYISKFVVDNILRHLFLDFLDYNHRLSYEFLTELAYLKYESSNNDGMIIATKSKNQKMKIEFSKIIKRSSYFDMEEHIKNINYIRKLLQTTNDKMGLVYDGARFVGIDFLDNYEECVIIKYKKGNIFTISTIDNKINKQIMQVRNGIFEIPQFKIDENEFKKRAKECFKEVSEAGIDNIMQIVKDAGEQHHGTTMIISNKAEDEANRLGDVSTKIKPINLVENRDIIESITSIDGAVLIDEKGICYAIGVILDGEYGKDGHAGRGARYNSCNTYIKSRKDGNYLAVVFSEDGHINYF